MDNDELVLAELLCARLCHDMAGAVGAAAAGAELLEEGHDAETAQLVAASAAGAVARLKFFRAALGPAGADQPALAVRDLADSYLRAVAASGGGVLSLRWHCERPVLDGALARLVLNMVLLARDGLPRGGEVVVDVAEAALPGQAGVTVVFRGPGAALGDEIARAIAGRERPAGARTAQAWAARCLAGSAGGHLALAQLGDEGRITA